MRMFKVLAAIALAAAALTAGATEATAPSKKPSIDPRADKVMRDMSNYLTSLKSFRVESEAVDEVVTQSGQKIQAVSDSVTSVRRPDRLRSERVGPVADVVFRYDGKSYSLFGKRTGYYATAPAPAKLDQAIDDARARLGIEAPGADLLMSRPYEILMENVTSGQYLGLEPVKGVACHHLAFRTPEVDWQIWVEDGRRPLPRRMTIVSKTETGQPEFAVDLSKWDVDAKLPDDLFTFTPPPGAKKIRFLEAKAPGRTGG